MEDRRAALKHTDTAAMLIEHFEQDSTMPSQQMEQADEDNQPHEVLQGIHQMGRFGEEELARIVTVKRSSSKKYSWHAKRLKHHTC